MITKILEGRTPKSMRRAALLIKNHLLSNKARRAILLYRTMSIGGLLLLPMAAHSVMSWCWIIASFMVFQEKKVPFFFLKTTMGGRDLIICRLLCDSFKRWLFLWSSTSVVDSQTTLLQKFPLTALFCRWCWPDAAIFTQSQGCARRLISLVIHKDWKIHFFSTIIVANSRYYSAVGEVAEAFEMHLSAR